MTRRSPRRPKLLVLAVLGLLPPVVAVRAGPADGLRDLSNELIHGGTLDGRPPTAFTWSPDGSRLAWLRRTTEGGKSPALQIHDMASKSTTTLRIDGEAPDEERSITSFDWNPKGDAIVAVSKGDLLLFEALGSASPPPARRLAKTDADEKEAGFSPDGTMIAFVRDHDVWVMELSSGKERRLTAGGSEGVLNGEIDWVYEEEFEISRGWWWSPDSRRIAYLQFDQRMVPTYPIVDWIPTHPEVERQHYPKAGDDNSVVKVGVVAVRGDGTGPEAVPPTRWIDLGGRTDIYIPRVAWTGDPATLAVQRLDREQTLLELLLCDVERGTARRILEESDPKWINIGDDWRFLAGGDRFIWGSERDGHRHLYLYTMDGKLIRRLTEGAWDVMDLSAVDEKRGEVYFMSTMQSPLERHLYRVGLDGAGPHRVTAEKGWHATWVAGGGAWVDSFSNAMTPPAVTLRARDGSLLQTIDEGLAKMLAGYRRGRVEFREVTAADGTRLPVMMTLPPDFDPARRHPVLVYVYGGPHAQVVTDQWGGARGLWHQMMAARGLIIWSLDNRGMGGRGHAWEAPIYRSMGRQELADQLAGVEHLRTLPYVDSARIGIWGWSYGGYMTLYGLLNAPDTFQAGVAVAPVTDWRDYDTIYTERYMDRPADNPDGYRESAPLQKAASLKVPLLLVHGSSDDNVHMQNSVQLLDAFVAAGRQVDFMLYPKKNHGITGPAARTHLYEKITRFLTAHLMGPGGAP